MKSSKNSVFIIRRIFISVHIRILTVYIIIVIQLLVVCPSFFRWRVQVNKFGINNFLMPPYSWLWCFSLRSIISPEFLATRSFKLKTRKRRTTDVNLCNCSVSRDIIMSLLFPKRQLLSSHCTPFNRLSNVL